MNKEFIESFDQLSVNTKRNEISRELMITGELLKSIETIIGMTKTDLKVDNYNSNRGSEVTETEELTFLYSDIYEIKQEVKSILAAMIAMKK